jgi:hypothetical protein
MLGIRLRTAHLALSGAKVLRQLRQLTASEQDEDDSCNDKKFGGSHEKNPTTSSGEDALVLAKQGGCWNVSSM